MSRPSQLLLIVVIYALGVSIALAGSAGFDRTGIAAGLIALVPTAASVHYANEYADYETDALADRTPFSGGSGALHETGLPRRLAAEAMVVTLAVGSILAVAGWVLGVLAPVSVGLLAVAAVFGIQYSLPPFAFSRRGLGEIDNAVLGGLVLPCYGAAAVGGLTLEVALAVVPFTLLVFVNLLETQWPDRYADADTGKDTLAVRWPKRRLRAAYAVVTVAAFGSLVYFSDDVIPWTVTLATLPAIPIFAWGTVRYTRRKTPFPAVIGMVAVGVLQLLAWSYLAAF